MFIFNEDQLLLINTNNINCILLNPPEGKYSSWEIRAETINSNKEYQLAYFSNEREAVAAMDMLKAYLNESAPKYMVIDMNTIKDTVTV